jgi:hypothetical protein
MVDKDTPKTANADLAGVIGTVGNLGEPLRFTNAEPLIGFCAESARGGQQVKIFTKLSLTSDSPLFHRLIQNLTGVINHMAGSTPVSLGKANTILLVLKPDSTAELWVDTAAVMIRCAVKRAIAVGTVVFETDIADITGMSFPAVELTDGDKVVCIFRVDWRFGMFFDFNPDSNLDREGFVSALGRLYREMRYWHLYSAITTPQTFENLLKSGWFPFAEIITEEFKEILQHCEAGFDVEEIEPKVVDAFDGPRLQHLLDRWLVKPHFANKKDLLTTAITAFRNKEPISVIKILLTEIEGVLNDAFFASTGTRTSKLERLLRFAEENAERKAGGPDTLLFPKAFGQYLRQHTFANYNPAIQTGTAGSRHAVGHGGADSKTYTMARALQAILTLDQLAFYT